MTNNGGHKVATIVIFFLNNVRDFNRANVCKFNGANGEGKKPES